MAKSKGSIKDEANSKSSTKNAAKGSSKGGQGTADNSGKKNNIPKSNNSSNAHSKQAKPGKTNKSSSSKQQKSSCSLLTWISILVVIASVIASGFVFSTELQAIGERAVNDFIHPNVLAVQNYINSLQASEEPEVEDRERVQRNAEDENNKILNDEDDADIDGNESKMKEDEEEERRKEEEMKENERMKALKEEEKKRIEEEKRKEEERQKALKEEAERQEKLRKEEEERKRIEEEKRKEEERQKALKEDAERQEKLRKEAEERKRMEEEKRKEEERKRVEEEKRKEEERKRVEEEKRREEERKRVEEEKRKEEERKRVEEEKRKEREEQERQKALKEEAERKEKLKKEEEERKRVENEKKEALKREEEKKEKERQKALKEEQERKEKEKKAEAEKLRKEKEEKEKQAKAEKLKKEEERKEQERQKVLKEEKERKAIEEEKKEALRKEQEKKEKERQKEEEEKKEALRKEQEKKASKDEKKKEKGGKSAEKEEKKPVKKDKVEESKKPDPAVADEKKAKGEDKASSPEVYARADISNADDLTIRHDLDEADGLFDKEKYEEALKKYNQILKAHPNSPRATYGKGLTLDKLGFKHMSNDYLEQAITFLDKVLTLTGVPDQLLMTCGRKLAERQQFRGWGQKAVKTYKFLTQSFPNDLKLLNELGVQYLLIGKNERAREVFNDVLVKNPNSGFAKVHLGFILKTTDNDLDKAIPLLKEGIESREEGTSDGRFYVRLGDALMRVGQVEEARHYFKEAEEKGLFLSQWQRSLYNVKGLTGQPFWTPQQSGYQNYVKILEDNWQIIRDEGLAQLNVTTGAFIEEDENLRDTGDWKQLTLYQQGRKNKENCVKTPKTCALIDQIPAAKGCRRGQVKFSVMSPGLHVWPHTGPTNCRLRGHLGLVIPEGPRLRVVDETRLWQEGKMFIFDDSFEHEVWHDGSQLRLVLIVDFWHPELTEKQRKTLAPI